MHKQPKNQKPMPVKNKRSKRNKRKLTARVDKKIFKLFLYLPVVLVALFILYVVIMPAKYWDGKTRLSLAVAKKDGTSQIAVFDPQSSTINVVVIPQNTEVEVAWNWGKMKSLRGDWFQKL